ncbi:MAG: cofactor-independent phosphoglycerate mutase [Deltaproteobacteria bacterium]|nr:cofactor-independent phosphoglycerate mutase [Candidatus Zymogenaceae bacterium]
MKYIVLLGDGMADEPVEALGGKTPLEAARTPNMDRIAADGVAGIVRSIPEGFPPGSDVANLSIMGFDPVRYYTGRAPIEAASLGIEMNGSDIAYRMNLVTLGDGQGKDGRRIMADYSAGHIPDEDSHPLVEALDRELGNFEYRFYPGKSYRHILVWKNGKRDIITTPPHDIINREIGTYLPYGYGAGRLLSLMREGERIMADHPVNRGRVARGKPPATSPWFWGQGGKPNLVTYRERWGIEGAVISAVDLIQGLGILSGLSVIQVPGATGWIDTNYRGKVEAALGALADGADFVYLHVEAPDEAGHTGDAALKVRAIEEFDAKVVGPVLAGLSAFGRHRCLVLPDHPTPVGIRTHSSTPVPFAAAGAGLNNAGADGFSEAACGATGLFVSQGHMLIESFFEGTL